MPQMRHDLHKSLLLWWTIASSKLGAHLCLLCAQTVQVTEAIKEAKDAKKEAIVELEKGADTVVR